MIMASPPFSWAIDLVFGFIFLLWIISSHTEEGSKRRWFHNAIGLTFIALLMAMLFVELTHRRMPRIEATKTNRLVVIGDSVSAGLGERFEPWPNLMQQLTGVEVRNLSKPGATVADGSAMADGVLSRDRLILIELGGNDLLEGERPEIFASKLETLFAKLSASGRTVIMFELPLLPEMIPYGQAQRRLARRFHVLLIPKRYLARILSGRDATSDGLHLTDIGAHRMASTMAKILSPALKKIPAEPTSPAIHL